MTSRMQLLSLLVHLSHIEGRTTIAPQNDDLSMYVRTGEWNLSVAPMRGPDGKENGLQKSPTQRDTYIDTDYHQVKESVMEEIQAYMHRENVKPLRNEPEEELYISKTAPDCAKNSIFNQICDNDEDYNKTIKELFSDAIEQSHLNDSLLSKALLTHKTPSRDEQDLEPGLGSVDEDALSGRSGTDSQEILDTVCHSEEYHVCPPRGKTKEGHWVYLLNQEGYNQCFRIYKCSSPKNGCSFLEDGELAENTACLQKFVWRVMIALDKTGKKVTLETVVFPSCCSCYRRFSLKELLLPRNAALQLQASTQQSAADYVNEGKSSHHQPGKKSTGNGKKNRDHAVHFTA